MPVKLIVEKDNEFYSLVGPYLASRSVAKEIGYHVYDDDKTQWVVSLDRNRLAAFALFRVVNGTATVTACYTVEQFRMQGVMRKLMQFAMLQIEVSKFRATANKNSLKMFKSLGFQKIRDNGSFSVMEICNA
jgi:predicted GNAT family acetyltransferase